MSIQCVNLSGVKMKALDNKERQRRFRAALPEIAKLMIAEGYFSCACGKFCKLGVRCSCGVLRVHLPQAHL